jgi:hypothetical protein
MTDIRGTAFMRSGVPAGFIEMDSTELDTPGKLVVHADPYAMEPEGCATQDDAPDRACSMPDPSTSPAGSRCRPGRGRAARARRRRPAQAVA